MSYLILKFLQYMSGFIVRRPQASDRSMLPDFLALPFEDGLWAATVICWGIISVAMAVSTYILKREIMLCDALFQVLESKFKFQELKFQEFKSKINFFYWN